MIDKFAGAIKDVRSTLGVTQIEFAKKLGVGVPSLAHYETAGRRPEAATTALLCRAAHDAGRIDLAEVFAAALPGVEDGLLVPCSGQRRRPWLFLPAARFGGPSLF